MSAYIDRDEARRELIALGVPCGKSGLANMASDGTGPTYTIINGRALYTREGLIRWVDQQAARPVVRRRQRLAS